MSVYIISNTSVLFRLTYEHTSVSLCVDVRVPLRNVLRSAVVALYELQIFNFDGYCPSGCTSSHSQWQLQWFLFLPCHTLIFVRFLGTKLYLICSTCISLMTSRSKHFNLFHTYGLRGFPSFANYPHIYLPLFSIELFTFSYWFLKPSPQSWGQSFAYRLLRSCALLVNFRLCLCGLEGSLKH